MQLSAGRGAAAMLGLALAMLAGLAIAQTPGAAAPERIAIGLLDQRDAGDYAAAAAGFGPNGRRRPRGQAQGGLSRMTPR